jgi:predicted ATP-grasp superfamily ATP-dependent carboligase
MRPVIPAVVVGGSLNALGVVRSLAGAGVPVYLAAETRFCPAGFSRHCTLLRVPDVKEQGLIDGLRSIARVIGERAVLILSGDQQVVAVSRARAELEAHYYLALPTVAMVDVLGDKAKFQSYAEEVGLRVPRAVILDDGRDLGALDTLTMPVILKPADKGLVLDELVERATRADTLDEARVVARRMRGAASSVVAQEWIDGNDDDIYFTFFVCDDQARIVALFTGRKIVCDPPRVGNTAVCVAALAEHQSLTEQTQTFVSHSRYAGIGGLEFKRDRRTGHFVVVEPTVGRTDWQEEIATLCGVNIPLIAYRTLLGKPSPSPGAMDPAVAWRSSVKYRLRAGALPPGTRIVDGYFRGADPLPGLYHYLGTPLLVRLAQRARRFVKSANHERFKDGG